jgi:sugar phosphate permease
VFGLGIGLAFASMANLIVQSVPAEQTGAATGMNANIRTIGGSLGAAVMSSLVTGNLQASGLPAESGYTEGFALLAVLCLAASLTALLVPARTVARRAAAVEKQPTLVSEAARR